jgi:hypothetical protein
MALDMETAPIAEMYPMNFEMGDMQLPADIMAAAEQFNTVAMEKLDTINMAIEAARMAIMEAQTNKQTQVAEVLADKEAQLRWAISSVYDSKWQTQLTNSLDKAKSDFEAKCVAKDEELMTFLDGALARWETKAMMETEALTAHAAAQEEAWTAAKMEQTELLTQSLADVNQRHTDWSESEKMKVEEFITECNDAWKQILSSYCLQTAEDAAAEAAAAEAALAADAEVDGAADSGEHVYA